MAEGDRLEPAGRFAALYRTWNGRIPLDDLLPYQAWHATLDREASHGFKVAAFAYILRSTQAPDSLLARRVARHLNEWFPRG
jgi:hypothetical protein